MKNINIKRLFRSGFTGHIIIPVLLIVLIYLLISLYFTNHFFFNTEINGVDVSLKECTSMDQLVVQAPKILCKRLVFL